MIKVKIVMEFKKLVNIVTRVKLLTIKGMEMENWLLMESLQSEDNGKMELWSNIIESD